MRHFDNEGFRQGLDSRREGDQARLSLRARRTTGLRSGSEERLNRSSGYLTSRLVMLGLLIFLTGMVFYALVTFFYMVRVRGLNVREIFFVPVGLVAALVVLLAGAHRLFKAIKQVRPPDSSL